MGKSVKWMQHRRKKSPQQPVSVRLTHWQEYQRPLPETKYLQQASRCLDCGTPYCQTGSTTIGCPLMNLIPEWNQLVAVGHWQEALRRLEKTNNFPEFTGRACPAPCEGSCTVGISDTSQAVSIKSIEQEIVDRGFAEGWIQPRLPKKRTGKRVAVVGSGPAGLACADQLNQAGHMVTVFEKADRIGGLLMYGIPNMKLEKRIVERRVNLLTQEGIHFITQTAIGVDIPFSRLESHFDAVILCTGAQVQRDLNIPGRDLRGIHMAMHYLTEATQSLLNDRSPAITAEGKDVIVIGGGDTGADCVATALRQNCQSVVQFGKHPRLPEQRRTNNPWPEVPQIFTMDYASEEAKGRFGVDPRQYQIQTKAFEGDEQGQVQALQTIAMDRLQGDHGEVIFQEREGTEKRWSAQLILVAVGFQGTSISELETWGIDHDGKLAKAEYGKYSTNREGVFAAGDIRRGQSLIVWAIHEGREVARECDRYLMGETVLP